MGHFFSSKSSLTPETQPNDYLRRRLVEFLVFNSAFGRWLSLNSVYNTMITHRFFFYQVLQKSTRSGTFNLVLLKNLVPETWYIFKGPFKIFTKKKPGTKTWYILGLSKNLVVLYIQKTW